MRIWWELPPATVDEFSKLFSRGELPKCERQRAEILPGCGRSMLRPTWKLCRCILGELQLLVGNFLDGGALSRRESRRRPDPAFPRRNAPRQRPPPTGFLGQ